MLSKTPRFSGIQKDRMTVGNAVEGSGLQEEDKGFCLGHFYL